jgi:hypothetical protein
MGGDALELRGANAAEGGCCTAVSRRCNYCIDSETLHHGLLPVICSYITWRFQHQVASYRRVSAEE